MATSKMMGVLILCAIAMGLFFMALRKDVFKVVGGSTLTKWVTYFVLYVFFTLVLWGLILLVWYAVLLITG